MSITSENKQGFTIIEVVLVLAIAGLIFLMVFVALPALQRSQRDTARRNDLSRVDTALVQYQTNHQNTGNGDLPSAGSWTGTDNFEGTNACQPNDSACLFVREYMNSGSGNASTNEFKDPDGTAYSVAITQNWSNKTKAYGGGFNGSDFQVSSPASVNAKGTIVGDNAYNAHVIWIVPGGRCEGSSVVPSQARHFAVLYRLEGAGVFCTDDQ